MIQSVKFKKIEVIKTIPMHKTVRKDIFLLFVILIIAAFVRFYHLSEMANFDFDQEYAVNFAYSVTRVFPIQLIGQPLSVEGLFMGPLYFYYLVPFFAVSGLHPLGGFAGSAVLGLITTTAYFFIGKKLFGIKAGLIAALIRSFLFTELIHDLSMTPAYACELLVLLTWWAFYKYWHGEIKNNSSDKLFPFLGFLFGLYTSIHPILFPFYLVFIILILIKRELPKLKTTVLSFIACLIPTLPLLVFEYLHQFLEVKKLFSLFTEPTSEPKNLSRLTHYLWFNLSEPQRILSLQSLPKELFSILFLGLIIFLIIKKIGVFQHNFHKIMLFTTYFVFIIYYTLFPTHVPEYYFLALTTLSLLYISAVLALLINKRAGLIVCGLLLINIIFTNSQKIYEKWTNPSLITLYHKDFIVKKILERQPKNEEFFVSYISLPGWVNGFNYLFKLYGQVPQTREASPPVYTIVIPKFLVSEKDMNFTSGNIGLILPE